jgi:hypothetical protein
VRIAVLDTVYQGYVQHLYQDGSLAEKSWEEQYQATVAGGFPTLSAWVGPLRSKGHEVMDIWGNHMPLQFTWCIENDATEVLLRRAESLEVDGQTVRLRPVAENRRPLFVDIVAEQIRRFKPDVVVSGYLHDFDSDFLRSISGHYRIAVGQHAAALPESDFSAYDAVISSLPNQVEFFQQHGVASYLVKLAFDMRLLDKLPPVSVKRGLIFAGQVSQDHKLRAEALLALGREIPIDVFGSMPVSDDVVAKTKIRTHPALWGLDMYRIMSESAIVFNRHIDAAGIYANNLRLYEATGSGSMLLTDWKTNMDEILTPGVECITYRDTAECVELAQHYLRHEDERAQVAARGRARILAEHTYEHRVEELLDVIAKHLD